MFLAAVSRPSWNYHLHRQFNGKIGIWPLVQRASAQRSSKNRPKGTIVTKPLTVTKDVYRHFLITKVFPAIRETMPKEQNTAVHVQQDNTKLHVLEIDTDVLAAGKKER